MPRKMRIVRLTDPNFEKILESGQLVSGGDVEAEMAKIKGEDHPGASDVVVPPKSRK